MSYQYSFQKTTTSQGYSSSSLVVHELKETEVSDLPLTSDYEISDEDRLTPYDFYSLMESEGEETETESESDVEYHWFPSLLKKSVIEFLEDTEEEEDFMEQDEGNVLVIENEDTTEEEEVEKDDDKKGNKRYKKHHRRSKKHTKKPKKSDIVPVEVVTVVL